MKRITLDCAHIDSKEALHRALAKGLDFPEWYGNNLDALYDCLTEFEEPMELTLVNFRDPGGFRDTLEDAAGENDFFTVLFI